MMKRYIFSLFALCALILSGCSSGQQAFEKGDYDKAVETAVNRLRRNGDHGKTRETLKLAYPYAKDRHLSEANALKTSADPLKWEKMVHHYEALNKHYADIKSCPACSEVIKSPVKVTAQLDRAKQRGAEVRSIMGNEQLDLAISTRDKGKAREAYNSFLIANRMVPGYQDVEARLMEAKDVATTKVVVEPVAVYDMDLLSQSEYFNNRVLSYISNLRLGEFIEFYSSVEAGTRGINQPDHVVLLRFDDFKLGQLILSEKKEVVKRDSVVLQTIQTDKGPLPIYGTVSATVTEKQKTLKSSGILDFRVMEPSSNRVLTQSKFNGSYDWQYTWGWYNGDERALEQYHRDLVNRPEATPPSEQEMFRKMTDPIYDQVTARLRSFYASYQ